MREAITKLVDVLAVEERVHHELRALLSDERERMLELDAESLYELALKKEILAEQGQLAQDARILASAELARALGLSEEKLTLSRLCLALGDAAGPLREAQSRLLSIVGAVAELSEANQRLGGERLREVRNTLELLGRLAPMAAREPAERAGQIVRRTA